MIPVATVTFRISAMMIDALVANHRYLAHKYMPLAQEEASKLRRAGKGRKTKGEPEKQEEQWLKVGLRLLLPHDMVVCAAKPPVMVVPGVPSYLSVCSSVPADRRQAKRARQGSTDGGAEPDAVGLRARVNSDGAL